MDRNENISVEFGIDERTGTKQQSSVYVRYSQIEAERDVLG